MTSQLPSSSTLSHFEPLSNITLPSAARLHVVLDCDRPDEPPMAMSLAGSQRVTLGRAAKRRIERKRGGEVALHIADQWMSYTHARMERDGEHWVIHDLESKNGMLVRGERTNRAMLVDGDIIELGHTMLLFRERVPIAPHDDLDVTADNLRAPSAELATFAPALARNYRELALMARTTVPVLIQGESGTGKELAARALHRMSGRTGEFVAVNCGSLAANIVESELFGCKKGAFSGATEDRVGLVRASSGGTLFLDEIGDLPESTQATLLRVLQEREVLPVGASRPITVDLRVVCATHRDLDGMARKNEFRADLLARLAGFRLELMPLRERREDLGLLVRALLARIVPKGEAGVVALTCKAARALLTYRWPLNIRELEQALATAVRLATGGPIDVRHLPEAIRAGRAARMATVVDLAEEERRRYDALITSLIEHHGNVAAVARTFGKASMQIHRWLQRYGIDPNEYRRP